MLGLFCPGSIDGFQYCQFWLHDWLYRSGDVWIVCSHMGANINRILTLFVSHIVPTIRNKNVSGSKKYTG
jgi:hypothetical protein